MATIATDRNARRRSIAFGVLVVACLVLMAFSSNPLVRELQSGVGFAFRPIQGALSGVASGVASIGAAISEIDRLRVDNGTLRADNERRLTENTRLQEIARENAQLTDLLQLRAGFEFQTAAAHVISRESSEFRRLVKEHFR